MVYTHTLHYQKAKKKKKKARQSARLGIYERFRRGYYTPNPAAAATTTNAAVVAARLLPITTLNPNPLEKPAAESPAQTASIYTTDTHQRARPMHSGTGSATNVQMHRFFFSG